MAELLLELLSEEIPARMQAQAADDLAALARGVLDGAGIGYEDPIQAFATPRRLALRIGAVPPRQADRLVERKGPRADAPAPARDGFLRSLAGLEFRLETRPDRKGEVLFALIHEPGRPTAEILAEKLPEALARFPWPKSMRWGTGELRWARPLHGILCLLGGEVVRFTVGGVDSGERTVGHRFAAPEAFQVKDFKHYVDALDKARVVLGADGRRELIRTKASALAAQAGLQLVEDPALIEEIAGLVEWPVPLLGAIDAAFMALPPEVLVTTMRTNQKYLALRDGHGRLAPKFITVANIAASDGGQAIIAGNERVLRARLWDARFFWDQDRRQPLESFLPKLDGMVFHERLGTQAQRVERLVALAGALVPHVPGADRLLAERAALLCKADLVTGMVGEFPELQGIMGGHYADAQGEPADVVAAIREHYAPKGPDDACPAAPASVVVALADKLDALTGFFAAGIRPTGSGDPFALRRAALGVIRLVLENGLRLDLAQLVAAALRGYAGVITPEPDAAAVTGQLADFLADRLKVQQRGAGTRHDLIAAVFATGRDGDLVRLLKRVAALGAFLATGEGTDLLAGYRRAANIVALEERKDGRCYREPVDPAQLVEPEERALHSALEDARATIAAALAAEDFTAAMAAVAELRGPIDAFFDRVMVNVADTALRANRLRLLAAIRSALDAVADFSLVEDAGRAR